MLGLSDPFSIHSISRLGYYQTEEKARRAKENEGVREQEREFINIRYIIDAKERQPLGGSVWVVYGQKKGGYNR